MMPKYTTPIYKTQASNEAVCEVSIGQSGEVAVESEDFSSYSQTITVNIDDFVE